MKKIKLAPFIILIFFCGISKATNYYVDPSTTSTTQNGAMATPWKTLTQVQNSMHSFAPGDFIYFKKGQTFTGTFEIKCSGTSVAPITFSSYGTAAELPLFTEAAESLILVSYQQYVVIDGFKITDPGMSLTDHNIPSNIKRAFNIDGSNYITIKNCDISLVGNGVDIAGNNNTVDHCIIQNLRMIRNTPTNVNSNDDYGGMAILINGSSNSITNNQLKDCWANSYDYLYDGGGVEIFGANTDNNKVLYNTVINSNGFMEFGSDEGGTSDNNLVAYNKLINCGDLVWVNNGNAFSIGVHNLQFFNNVIVETLLQLTRESKLIGMTNASSTTGMINLKNNIFWLTTGVDVAASGQFTSGQLVHEANIYHLGANSVLNFNMQSSEVTTTAAIFTSTTASDPAQWNYIPIAGGPAIDFGQNVGLTKDFAGNNVPSVPNSGILENVAAPPAVLNATATAGAISCNGGTATITVTASGGTAPYTGTGNFVVSAGTYSYTVTDAAGAVKNVSITVTQPSVITTTVAAGTIIIFGGSTSVTINASGGTVPYTYQLDGGSFQATNIFATVFAGSHMIIVKDANGCTSSRSVSLSQPAGISLSATAIATSINCNGGTATVTVTASGGTAPYTGTGNYTVNAGTYSYTVTDAAGAVKSVSITVTQPLVITSTVAAGTIIIFGGSTSVTINASGGTGPYTYQLDGGSFQATNIFATVFAGSHTIIVKDAKGCTSSRSISLSQPAGISLSASATATAINCNGGTATVTVTASGGTAPYTGTGNYTVNAGTYSYTVRDANGSSAVASITIAQPAIITFAIAAPNVTLSGGTTTATVTASGGTAPYSYKLNSGAYQASNVFSGVPAGTHTVTVKDAKACTSVKSFTVTVIAAPPALAVNVTAGLIKCNAGNTQVIISATGGTPPYTGVGTFFALAGAHSYTVTDAAGVTIVKSVTLTQPAAIAVTLTAGTINTYGASTTVTINATGGTGTYTYKMDTGAFQASNVFNNVPAGTFSFTVKDANSCSSVKAISLTQPVSGPFKLNLVVKTNVSCKGKRDGTIQVIGSGGTLPYSYKKNFGFYSANNIFSNLAPGTYTIKGKDATGATSAISVSIANSTITCAGSRYTGDVAEKPEVFDDIKINAFPNPTTNEFTLVVEDSNEEEIQIIVMNLNGQKVFEQSSRTNKTLTFGKSFIPGFYIVKIIRGEHSSTVKLIKN